MIGNGNLVTLEGIVRILPGYAFASVGANASLPIPFMPGSWSLNAGLTGYHTNDDVIPNNPEDAFLTGKLGLTLAF